MKVLSILLICTYNLCGQTIISKKSKDQAWLLNTGINLPALKFHMLGDQVEDDSNGYLELFSSFGVGVGVNFGNVNLSHNVETGEIIQDQTSFSNIIGFQIGVLYSSQIKLGSTANQNLFSIFTAINTLDLQIGIGKELGNRFQNTNGWFVSVAYGIPIYKLTGHGAHFFRKKLRKNHEDHQFASCEISNY